MLFAFATSAPIAAPNTGSRLAGASSRQIDGRGTIFHSADVGIVTKIDLAAVVEFDRAAAHANIQAVRPGMRVFEVSAKTGHGMEGWLSFLDATKAAATPVR